VIVLACGLGAAALAGGVRLTYVEQMRRDAEVAELRREKEALFALAERENAARRMIAELNARGASKREQGDLDGALAEFTKALQLDPNHVLSLTNRGEIYRRKGDLTAAITDLAKAVELDARNANVWCQLGAVRQ